MFEIGKLPSLDLGYQGENKVRTIDIDMTAWLEEYPGSKVALMVKRPDEDVYYPAGKMEGNVLLWVIDRADRQYAGRGEAQVILKGADDVELRTRVVKTKISPSLSGTEVEAPPPHSTWVGEVLDAAARAEAAVEKMPRISENKTWLLWNADAGEYVDSGITAQGIKGEKGDTGPVSKGLEILGAYDSAEDLTAEHPTGETGDAYLVSGDLYLWDEKTGEWVNAGHVQGAPGKNGENGHTPIKGTDYWTASDQQTIVNDVLSALPVYNGEVAAV